MNLPFIKVVYICSSQQADAFTDSNMIVLDDVDQYKDWSLQVKTELKRLELWDIVEGTDEPPKAKNDDAKALEVIKHSCRDDFGRAIENISSAKIAWDTLAGICTHPESKLHRYLYISL